MFSKIALAAFVSIVSLGSFATATEKPTPSDSSSVSNGDSPCQSEAQRSGREPCGFDQSQIDAMIKGNK